jgi:uncharacterized protein YgfB (UPF0149 family)
MKYEINTTTNKIIEREMTKQETDQDLKYQKLCSDNMNKIIKEAEAKASARQAILDRLGLTADEAKLLLG